jgi:hypothetical protein
MPMLDVARTLLPVVNVAELPEALREYLLIARLPDGRLVAISPRGFNTQILIDLGEVGYANAF